MTHAATPPPEPRPRTRRACEQAAGPRPGGEGEGRHRIAHALFGPTDRTNDRWSMPYRATLSHTSEQVRRFGHTVLFMVIAMDAPQIMAPTHRPPPTRREGPVRVALFCAQVLHANAALGDPTSEGSPENGSDSFPCIKASREWTMQVATCPPRDGHHVGFHRSRQGPGRTAPPLCHQLRAF